MPLQDDGPQATTGKRTRQARRKVKQAPTAAVTPTAAKDRAVEITPAGPADEARTILWQDRFRRDEIIRRLIVEGPDRLAVQIYRRYTADRRGTRHLEGEDVPSWTEIAASAKLAGLLDDREARLLASSPTEHSAPRDSGDEAGRRDR